MDDCARARIPAASGEEHPSLFPLADMAGPTSPQAFCRQIGFNWLALLDVHKRQMLSFDPQATNHLTRGQEAELRFLGRLIAAGCNPEVLKSLLIGLTPPYAYNLERMYYDWSNRQWRMLEDTEHIEQRFDDWLLELISWDDRRILERLHHRVTDALALLDAREAQRTETLVPSASRRAKQPVA